MHDLKNKIKTVRAFILLANDHLLAAALRRYYYRNDSYFGASVRNFLCLWTQLHSLQQPLMHRLLLLHRTHRRRLVHFISLTPLNVPSSWVAAFAVSASRPMSSLSPLSAKKITLVVYNKTPSQANALPAHSVNILIKANAQALSTAYNIPIAHAPNASPTSP